jgi:predicted Zn finger-like uncharacterized protein
MSLITRCPACGTMFKVVPDQLRISEGWVRCGNCADVFDAAAHLQRDDFDEQSSSPFTAPARQAKPSGAQAAAAQANDAPQSESFGSSVTTEIGESVGFEGPDSAQIEAEAQALVEHPLDHPFQLRRRDADTRDVSSGIATASELESGADSQIESDEEPGLDDVSFVKEARRKAFWGRPRVRALLAIGVVALTVSLVLQAAVHDRDRVAAAAPALRPWLARLCEPLNCRIGPPRQIDAIAIDSSSFNKLRGDAYRLNVTLKNQAAIELAMPALELTLTDGQDKAVVRRVLSPADLGQGSGVIAAASEWTGSLALAVAADGAGARISGYRLLAFYP